MTIDVITQRNGSLTTLTLNRPDRLNAVNASLVEALIAALDIAATDGTRLCVIKANGKGFSGGFDFGGLAQETDGNLVMRFLRIEQMLQAVYYAPFATLALAHGPCFGAGADLLAACGRRVAAPETTFRMPGLRFGVVLGTGRLARMIGTEAARQLLESTKPFDANEALDKGFVTDLAAQDSWQAIIDDAHRAAESLPVSAQRALLEQTRDDVHKDKEFAALARSVSEPGLPKRVRAFIEASKRSFEKKPR